LTARVGEDEHWFRYAPVDRFFRLQGDQVQIAGRDPSKPLKNSALCIVSTQQSANPYWEDNTRM
jgi:hypothetical protein